MEFGFYSILGLFVGIGILFLVNILIGGPEVDKAKRALWREVTRRLGGSLRITEGNHSIWFKWHGLDAVVLEKGQEVRFRIEDAEFGGLSVVLSYRSESALDRANLKVAIGWKRFDTERVEDFFVHSPDLPGVRDLVTQDVRRVFKDLAGSCDSESISVEIADGFQVRGRGAARDPERLARFCLLCLQMAQHARLFSQRSEGVKFVGEAAASGGECQVCGASLEGLLVKCGRCATPHHRDCWEYAGVCSTYACGSRERS